MKILDGKAVAAAWRERLLGKITELKQKNCVPGLAIVLAGDSKPSLMYARFMEKVADSYGFKAAIYRRGEEVTQQEMEDLIHQLNEDDAVHGILMMMPLPRGIDSSRVIACMDPDKDIDGLTSMEDLIHQLNEDDAVHGILMMMPLPRGIDSSRVIACMDPDKDIDGLTSVNLGRLAAGEEGHFPCTPRAVMAILDYYHIPLDGKRAVVLGRSKVVGRPVSLLLEAQNATVTVCHSHTADMETLAGEADILVAAMGRPEKVTSSMVKPGAVVIDVGINRVNGKTVGDVDFADVSTVAGALTPVPGGVGSVTTTMVVDAIVSEAEKRMK